MQYKIRSAMNERTKGLGSGNEAKAAPPCRTAHTIKIFGIMEVSRKFLIFLCLLGSCVPILASLVGAPRPLKNLNDPYVQNAAQFAVSEMNKQSNSLNKVVLIKVESGTVQVRDTTR